MSVSVMATLIALDQCNSAMALRLNSSPLNLMGQTLEHLNWQIDIEH